MSANLCPRSVYAGRAKKCILNASCIQPHHGASWTAPWHPPWHPDRTCIPDASRMPRLRDVVRVRFCLRKTHRTGVVRSWMFIRCGSILKKSTPGCKCIPTQICGCHGCHGWMRLWCAAPQDATDAQARCKKKHPHPNENNRCDYIPWHPIYPPWLAQANRNTLRYTLE